MGRTLRQHRKVSGENDVTPLTLNNFVIAVAKTQNDSNKTEGNIVTFKNRNMEKSFQGNTAKSGIKCGDIRCSNLNCFMRMNDVHSDSARRHHWS